MKLPSLIVCLAVLLISIGFSPQQSRAAGVVGNGTPGSCTEAAFDAAAGGGGLVTFNCGGPATITFTSQKQVNNDIAIDGGGVITISGGNSVGIAVMGGQHTLTLENLTIVDANGGLNGAFFNVNATFAFINCTFSGNSGLVIFNNSAANVLTTITNSTFSGNSGGVISNSSGATLTITDSTFSSNSGGVISTSGGTLTIAGSTFSGNNGGAINALAGTLTITNSTFSGNTTSGYSANGAVSNGGTLTVINSTFSGNTGSGSTHPSSLGNYGTLTLINTIVANSTNGPNCKGTIIDGGHNIDDGATCGFSTANGSLNNTNPLLDSTGLQNNGGPTQTIALCAGAGIPSAGCTGVSPGIDAGDETVCAAAPVDNLDQRGYGRPGAGETNCSIGAYEYNGQPSLEPTATATETPVPTSNATSTPTAVPTPTVVSCVGDCNGDGQVTVDEILTMVNIALGNTDISMCEAGDANHDDQITVDEILTAVNNALNGCPSAAEQSCLKSGGAVTTALCCIGTDDFPNTCTVGSCGCSPDASHEVRVCDCSAGTCFNGSTGCVTCPFGTCPTDSE